jgi:hypothetical protein
LSRAKYHALTAAADLFQQFVIAKFTQQLEQTLASGSNTWRCIHLPAVIARGDCFFVE